ncbi:hypothetical protein EJB05_57032 [Eragrostis curvula]|uniref:Plant heme peroxidase family profile domain-containing protein n=1 Tax=Eragrostis curvula TaxID=38414 RepID=A0A5J9SFP2_9POAL|nr:hypothetical protein EJB05_57032 [Eragrostis curvula]
MYICSSGRRSVFVYCTGFASMMPGWMRAAVEGDRRMMDHLMRVVAAALLAVMVVAEALSLDYYDDKCPGAEAAVTAAVRQAMATDRTVPAGLLRMHFHDCFVRVSREI